MAVAAIMPPSMPSSKKRCWNLLVKDVRNNAQEAEVLSSFRKRYTSTRKLAFRPVTDYAGGSTTTSTPPPPPTDNTTTTTTITQGGRACIEIQFTGPQPIEGPAGLMCNILQATFVSAHPVQLDRGRKRKTRPGGGGGSRSSLASSTPLLAETSEEGCSRSVALKTTAADTASATAGDSPASSSNSSSSSSGSSGGAPGAAMKSGAAAAKHEDLSAYVSDTTSYASSRTSSSSDLLDLLDHDDGSSSSSSSSSSSNATWADVGELPSTSSPFSPNQEQQHAVEDDDMVVSDDDICTAFGGAFGGEGGLILGGGGGGSLSAPVPATTADFPASSASPPPCLGRSCSVMTAEGNDLPRWDDVIRGVESPPSSGGSIDEADASGDRLPAAAAAAPPPPPLGARPASGDTDDPAPASASCPGLARGTSYDECRAGVMSQEEAVSLFAATGAATAEPKPPASAAAAAAGDGQWEGAPDDDPDAPFCPLALERHCSSTWALLDPTHAGAAAAAVTVAGEEGTPDHRRASIVPDPCLAAESSEEQQQQPTMWYGEGPHHSAVPAGGGLELPPAGDTIAFGWCEQECDFDGNYAARPSKAARVLPPTAATSFFPDPSAVAAAAAACTSSPSSNSLNNRCRFAFLGLESELRDFTVCARFSVDPASRVERFASLPLDGAAGGGGDGDPAGAVGGRRGQVDAAVEFPSIMEIWPEVYKVDNIRVMEVDMVVEVRSSEGNILYTGPTLKITYRRSAARTSAPTDAAAAAALMA